MLEMLAITPTTGQMCSYEYDETTKSIHLITSKRQLFSRQYVCFVLVAVRISRRQEIKGGTPG